MGLGDDDGRTRPERRDCREAAAPRRSQRRLLTIVTGTLLTFLISAERPASVSSVMGDREGSIVIFR